MKKGILKRFEEEQGGLVKYRPNVLEDDSWVVSQFLITYNTNRPENDEAKSQLASLHTRMTTRLSLWKEVVKIAPVGRSYHPKEAGRHETLERTEAIPESANLRDEVRKGFAVTVKAVEMETGPDRKRLHGHCLVKIRHKSRLHIDTKRFKSVMNAELEEVGSDKGAEPIRIEYVNVKWIPHHSYAVKKYVEKGKLKPVFEAMRIEQRAAQ